MKWGSLALLVVGWALPGDARAIIMRHDVPESEYAVDDADFPALVDLFEPGDCIGTLISPDYLLTVAHCAVDMSTGQALNVGGEAVQVEAITSHPEYRNFKHDIALIRVSPPLTTVTPHGLYAGEDELGRELILVGRGLHGTGLEGEPGAAQDTQLRRATNVVTKATDQWLEVNFEAPESAGVTDLEGVGASGDSGGPAFLETSDGLRIAGLNSWGEGPGSIRVGQYGAQDYATRVSQFVPWIEEVTGLSVVSESELSETADTGTDDTGAGGGDPSASGKGCGCTVGGPLAAGLWPLVLLGIGLARRERRIPGHLVH